MSRPVVREMRIVWNNHPDNKELRDVIDGLPDGAYIAGGSVASIFAETAHGDIDVFFTDEKHFNRYAKKAKRQLTANNLTAEELLEKARNETISWKTFRQKYAKLQTGRVRERGTVIRRKQDGRIAVEYVGKFYMDPHEQVRRFDHLGIAMAIQKRGRNYFLIYQEGAIEAAESRKIIWKREDRGDRSARRKKYNGKGWAE